MSSMSACYNASATLVVRDFFMRWKPGLSDQEQVAIGRRITVLMASRFEKIAGDNIGIMLPASVATDIAFIAAHLAGKLPVLMNWTTGPANLAHAAKLTKLTQKQSEYIGVPQQGPFKPDHYRY